MYNTQLCLIAEHMGYSKQESEDFVQEFFLEILQKQKLEPIVNPKSFLALSFKRRLIDFYRKNKRLKEGFLQMPQAIPESSIQEEMERIQEDKELLSKVATAYRKIPARCRTVIYLKYYKGLTTEEIVNQTGLSSQTVYNNLCKGVQLLRQELGAQKTGDTRLASLLSLLIF